MLDRDFKGQALVPTLSPISLWPSEAVPRYIPPPLEPHLTSEYSQLWPNTDRQHTGCEISSNMTRIWCINILVRVGGVSKKPFECHHCTKGFPKKADRDRHEVCVHRSKMEIPPRLHICPEKSCTRIRGFTRKDNLLDHLRRVHNRNIPKRKAVPKA